MSVAYKKYYILYRRTVDHTGGQPFFLYEILNPSKARVVKAHLNKLYEIIFVVFTVTKG